jgi:hypothetical protein
MDRIELGEVIAERLLEGEHEGRSITVTVKVGKPVPDPDGLWTCPYLISSPIKEKRFYAGGVDSVQALYLALHMIGAELRSGYREVRPRWYGREELGFPTYATLKTR